MPEINNKPVYLGDAVYCRFDGYHVRLYLNNGLTDYNEIAMEPEVIDSFLKYLKNNNLILKS